MNMVRRAVGRSSISCNFCKFTCESGKLEKVVGNFLENALEGRRGKAQLLNLILPICGRVRPLTGSKPPPNSLPGMIFHL